jgi:hypothetical protein
VANHFLVSVLPNMRFRIDLSADTVVPHGVVMLSRMIASTVLPFCVTLTRSPNMIFNCRSPSRYILSRQIRSIHLPHIYLSLICEHYNTAEMACQQFQLTNCANWKTRLASTSLSRIVVQEHAFNMPVQEQLFAMMYD